MSELMRLQRLRDPGAQGRAARHRRPARASPSGTAVVGYATVSGSTGRGDGEELKEQAELIASECERRGLVLMELVREREPQNGKGLERPGLDYALRRISTGEARGLVVSELSRLTRSVAELGAILKWFKHSQARLVAVDQALDTENSGGQLAARTLVEVSGWERERLSEQTRKGLQAARQKRRTAGRPAVSDYPELRARIARMRAQGMTLQAIADQLNDDGIPTVRGGTKWRHSSVQAAAGYKRQRRAPLTVLPPPRQTAREG